MSRAYAFDVRDVATEQLIGVGLLVPEGPALSFLTRRGALIEPELSAEVAGQLREWAAQGDALLPRRPSPMGAALLSSVLSDHASGNEARRFAAIPVANLAPFSTRRVLAGILSDRQSLL
jgi:hypothetical protein